MPSTMNKRRKNNNYLNKGDHYYTKTVSAVKRRQKEKISKQKRENI
jgi:hypothetical protein